MDFRTQLQRRPYGGLPIRFDGPVFQLHPWRQIRATLVGKRRQLKWASYFFPKAVSTVKRVSGSAHTLGREQGSEQSVSSGIRCGNVLPRRELARSCDTERQIGSRGDAYGVCRGFGG